MSGAKHIGTALTLGGAIVAISLLSSPPSEAKGHHFKKGPAGVSVGSKAFKGAPSHNRRFSHKRTNGAPGNTWTLPGKDPGIGKLPAASSQSNPTKAADVVKGPPDVSLAQDGRTPFPTPTTSTKSPKGLEDWTGTKAPKLPPIGSSEPYPGKLPGGGNAPKLPPVVSSEPLPPGTFDPGKLPGGGNGPKLPPVVGSEPLPGPFDPGKYYPPGGGKGPTIPPVVIVAPGGGDHALPSLPKDELDGAVVVVDNGCDPCAWLRRQHDQTGLGKWLDRYRQCVLWKQEG